MNTIAKSLHRPALRPPFPWSMASNHVVSSDSPSALDLDQLTPDRLRLREAIRLKSAELWLTLGLPELASRELESLPASADAHPWTMRVQMLVWSALTVE